MTDEKNEQVERVAKAICKSYHDYEDCEANDWIWQTEWEKWTGQARAAIAAATEWQDIKTAPTDGSSILLFTTDNGQVEAWFQKGEWTEHHEYGPEYNGAFWICGDDAFQIEVEEFSEEHGMHHGTATHWMPLPPSPSAQEGE